jgi:hypothetical protein
MYGSQVKNKKKDMGDDANKCKKTTKQQSGMKNK